MKNKLLVIIAICMAIFLTACTQTKEESRDLLSKIIQRDKMIVGVKFDTKPFGYINEKGQVVGMDIDLAKAIAKDLLGDGNKVEFKQVTPSNRILAVNSGQVDMVIATMTITPQRQDVVDFSYPYYTTGQVILVPKTSKITSIHDLNGKKVIIIFGSTAEKSLRLLAPDAKILGFKTYPSAYNALKEGRADAITSDETILMGFAMKDKSVKILPKKYTKEPYGMAFKKGSASINLINRIDFILKNMESTGELKQLKHKWAQS